MLFLALTSLLALYVAWNLGANDVANSMGTSVGSKAVTLRQALVIAGILEFTGAVLFGQRVSQTLVTKVVDPVWFISTPRVLLWGMVAALLSCGIWLQIATRLGMPVASSHAIVGAIAGFGWVAAGSQAVNWPSLRLISLTWVLTPLISGAIAACFYRLIQDWILNQPDPLQQMMEWIPWLSTALVSVFSVIVLPPLVRTLPIDRLPLPAHDVPLIGGAIAILLISLYQFDRTRQDRATFAAIPQTTTHFILEKQTGRFQLLSACCVAFAHGSNDVGNAVAPLAAIIYIQQHQMIPLTQVVVPFWVLTLGGVGIVLGLAVWGKNVIATIGEGLISLQPSGGFCAELATATTILLASRVGLPVSTSHALVGAVIGVGLVQQVSDRSSLLQLETIQKIVLSWLVTIPIAGGLSAGIFGLLRVLLWQW